MLQSVQPGWDLKLPDELLMELLRDLRGAEHVFPNVDQILRCFSYFSPQTTRVVLLGQDPYINQHVVYGALSTFGAGGKRKKQHVNEACGLSFSVPQTCPIPPSLRNMLKELHSDLNIVKYDGDLESWAQQGVLLLNAALTVIEGCSNSHAGLWAKWTDDVIRFVSNECSNVVFVLLGNFAKQKASLIDASKHHVLTFGHPSPLNRSVPFLGCKMYSKTNEFLESKGYSRIEW